MSTPPPLPQSQPTAEADDGTYGIQEPPQQAAYPQAAYPQQAYPQQAYPQASYPQGGYPQQAYAPVGYPAAQYAAPGAVPLAYAAPAAAYGGNVAWSEGAVLVVRKDAMLPPLCVRCNEPADGKPIKRNFSWHHPTLFLLILAGLLVYAIVALVVQKKGTVYLSLCPRHRSRRLMMGLTAGALALGGLAMMILAGAIGEGWPAAVGGLMLLAAIIMGVANQTLTAKRIDDHFLWLKGAGREFLANFPPTGRA